MLVAGAALVLAACVGMAPGIGQQFVTERVPEEPPDWLRRPPRDRDNKLFFVGFKTHASGLEDGNSDARQGAIQKIVEYIGGTGMVDYTKARVEAGLTDEGQAGNYIEDCYRFLAEFIAQGVRQDETYYEGVKEWRPDGWHYFYNYYVLISISQDALQRSAALAFERQAAAARARNDAKAQAFANSLRQQLTTDATSSPVETLLRSSRVLPQSGVAALPMSERTSIALVDFRGFAITQGEAAILSDRLRIELVRTGGFRVMERDRMNDLLREMEFGQSRLCDNEACVLEIGRLVQVQQIVTGTIGKLGRTYTINARMVDVETGRITAQASYDCPCEIDALLGSMSQVAAMLAENKP